MMIVSMWVCAFVPLYNILVGNEGWLDHLEDAPASAPLIHIILGAIAFVVWMLLLYHKSCEQHSA